MYLQKMTEVPIKKTIKNDKLIPEVRVKFKVE